MIINYTLSEQNYVDFFIYHYTNSKKAKLPMYILFVAFVTSLALICMRISNGNTIYTAIIVGMFGAIAAFLLPYFHRKFVTNRADKLLLNGQFPEGRTDCTTQLDKNVILNTNSGETQELNYGDIKRKKANTSYIFLYISDDNALVIPNTAFDSKTEREAFEKLLSDNGIH